MPVPAVAFVPLHGGLHMSTDTFIVVAGSIELLFGPLVISGAMPQVAVLVAAVPFNATRVLFGQTELVGHLPVYGVFLALLAYGSDPATAAVVPWLPRSRRHASDAPRPMAGIEATELAAGPGSAPEVAGRVVMRRAVPWTGASVRSVSVNPTFASIVVATKVVASGSLAPRRQRPVSPSSVSEHDDAEWAAHRAMIEEAS